MTKVMTLIGFFLIALTLSGCKTCPFCGPSPQELALQQFIDRHVAKVQPLATEMNLAIWDAANTGKSEDYDRVSRLELALRKAHSDPTEFAQLKAWKESGMIMDPLLDRQLLVLYNGFMENQIDPVLLKQTVDLSNNIQKKFSVFRGSIDGKKVTANDIDTLLKEETDSVRRQAAWEASKQVAPEVAGDLVTLVKLRNRAAVKLGYANYHTFSLAMVEQDVKELEQVFNALYEQTNEPFSKLKAELDTLLAKRCGISADEIKPWHYHDPFFQSTPLVLDVNLDKYYKGRDIAELSVKFFDSIGMPVDHILSQSDLFEREGKHPTAFCTDIDRQGDVRILCNLKDNEQWMEIQLHELGHAVYAYYMDHDALPYLLRDPAHIFATEGIAMFYGRLSQNPNWMQQMLDLTDSQRNEIAQVSEKYAQLKQIIFARWAMVMFNFEKELYANPDQDLNALWWQIVEKYQLVKKPAGRNAPDWAAKIHFTIAPCYYHNYLLGELFGSQLHQTLASKVLKQPMETLSYVNQKEAGDYIRTYVLEPGKRYYWNEMVTQATGEPLNPKYFVEQFVK